MPQSTTELVLGTLSNLFGAFGGGKQKETVASTSYNKKAGALEDDLLKRIAAGTNSLDQLVAKYTPQVTTPQEAAQGLDATRDIYDMELNQLRTDLDPNSAEARLAQLRSVLSANRNVAQTDIDQGLRRVNASRVARGGGSGGSFDRLQEQRVIRDANTKAEQTNSLLELNAIDQARRDRQAAIGRGTSLASGRASLEDQSNASLSKAFQTELAMQTAPTDYQTQAMQSLRTNPVSYTAPSTLDRLALLFGNQANTVNRYNTPSLLSGY